MCFRLQYERLDTPGQQHGQAPISKPETRVLHAYTRASRLYACLGPQNPGHAPTQQQILSPLLLTKRTHQSTPCLHPLEGIQNSNRCSNPKSHLRYDSNALRREALGNVVDARVVHQDVEGPAAAADGASKRPHTFRAGEVQGGSHLDVGAWVFGPGRIGEEVWMGCGG